MLNRASRTAAAVRYRKPAAHPTRPSSDSPHANARTAGATPNEMMSASESSSNPNALVVLVMRAIRPSSMSRTTAKPTNGAALTRSSRMANMMQA